MEFIDTPKKVVVSAVRQLRGLKKINKEDANLNQYEITFDWTLDIPTLQLFRLASTLLRNCLNEQARDCTMGLVTYDGYLDRDGELTIFYSSEFK